MRFLKLGKWHLSLGIVFFVVGLLIGTAFVGQRQWQLRDAVRKQRLVDVIRGQQERQMSLESQLKQWRSRISKIERDAARRQGKLSEFNVETRRLSAQAGLTRVSGDGLQIIIGDAPRVPSNADAYNYVVHDYDLQILINALWQGGAEAIAINGQRLTAISGVRGAGSTILVNNRPIGNPYKIVAIGPTESLVRVTRTDQDARQLLGTYARSFDLVTQITKVENAHVPAYTGSIVLPGVKARSNER